MKTQFIITVILALPTCAPVAQADTLDDQFMGAVAASGITGDRDMLIGDGHDACSNYGTPGLVGLVFRIMSQGYSNVQASDIVMAGVRAYCPQHLGIGM
jgi:Protein of unknown function (DUF732)